MREIVLDTETTGLNANRGDRIVEIGCVECINHVTTGKTYHVYLNPERDVPEEVVRVHGLTTEFLADKPLFSEQVDDFIAFIEDSPLVIHNASFDMGFLNAELKRTGSPLLPMERAIDPLEIAHKKFFGAPATLDALCKRFNIDSSARSLHGALLDAQLLAEVYLELCGGRQTNLDIALSNDKATTPQQEAAATTQQRTFLAPRPHRATEEEQAAHKAFLKKLKNPLWEKLAETE